jgi:hypothetical protein
MLDKRTLNSRVHRGSLSRHSRLRFEFECTLPHRRGRHECLLDRLLQHGDEGACWRWHSHHPRLGSGLSPRHRRGRH